MGQALEQKKEEKKRNLLEAARILFSQKGISKTSISEIAQAAKVAKGTFYLYFKDKDELLEHLILQISRNIVTLAYEHAEQHRTDDFTENVIIFVDYIITYFSCHQDSLSLIKRNLLGLWCSTVWSRRKTTRCGISCSNGCRLRPHRTTTRSGNCSTLYI